MPRPLSPVQRNLQFRTDFVEIAATELPPLPNVARHRDPKLLSQAMLAQLSPNDIKDFLGICWLSPASIHTTLPRYFVDFGFVRIHTRRDRGKDAQLVFHLHYSPLCYATAYHIHHAQGAF